MREAIRLSIHMMRRGQGGPFGAVVVRDGKIVGRGCNQVTSANDPTAHAEIVAVRSACRVLGSFQLTGCDIYASCEPCPMCLGAIYWSGIKKIVFAADRLDAAASGFSDSLIYDELALKPEKRQVAFIHVPDEGGKEVFRLWDEFENRITY